MNTTRIHLVHLEYENDHKYEGNIKYEDNIKYGDNLRSKGN